MTSHEYVAHNCSSELLSTHLSQQPPYACNVHCHIQWPKKAHNHDRCSTQSRKWGSSRKEHRRGLHLTKHVKAFLIYQSAIRVNLFVRTSPCVLHSHIFGADSFTTTVSKCWRCNSRWILHEQPICLEDSYMVCFDALFGCTSQFKLQETFL